MKTWLIGLFLSISSLLSADSLDIVFRYYTADGRMVGSPINLQVKDGSAVQLGKTDAGGWQQWRLGYQGDSLNIHILNGTEEQTLSIHIHPDWKKTLKNLVINRLQDGREP